MDKRKSSWATGIACGAYCSAPFYYLFKGMFLWAILSFFTLNGLWIGFPLFNRAIVLRHFHRNGWVQE